MTDTELQDRITEARNLASDLEALLAHRVEVAKDEEELAQAKLLLAAHEVDFLLETADRIPPLMRDGWSPLYQQEPDRIPPNYYHEQPNTANQIYKADS